MGECILGIIAIRKFGRLQVILTLLLIVACVSPLEIPDPVVLPVPGENLAKSAEAQFHDKSYNNALSIYENYLSRFPQGTSADIALHRVASIYLYRDDLARSRSAFQRLVNNYPRSPHMVPCGLDVMYAFKNQGNDTEVIRISADILKIADSQEALREVYYVLADIHFKKGAFMEALLFGEMAF